LVGSWTYWLSEGGMQTAQSFSGEVSEPIDEGTTDLMTQPSQQGKRLEDPPWLKETSPKRIVYTIPGMDQVQVRKDVTYKHAPERDLTADVYMPPDLSGDERRPGVVFIHGGYLPPNLRTQPKDWGVFVSYGQLMAASGLIGITFNHRYYGREYLDTAQSDIGDLLSYIRDRADQFALDRDRISLWAFSGGGPLVSWVIRDTPSFVRCLVLYYAVLEMKPNHRDTPATLPDEKLDEFSPVYQVQNLEKGTLPTFIARAGLDRPALNETIDRFIQAALSRNVTIDFSNHAGGHHGFDILDDDDRSREIIQRTVDFVRTRSF
jgi:acetyl esterase/lipase